MASFQARSKHHEALSFPNVFRGYEQIQLMSESDLQTFSWNGIQVNSDMSVNIVLHRQRYERSPIT